MTEYRQVARTAQLDRSIQSRIGRRLQAVYRWVVADPIPDDQIDLILALRRKEREQRRSRSGA
jgi:hypothetical protein